MCAAASRKVLITDTTLRDAHQSLIATRLRTEDMIPLAREIDACGFFSAEAWGGATFDTCIRFLNDDPSAPGAQGRTETYADTDAAPRPEPGRVSPLFR